MESVASLSGTPKLAQIANRDKQSWVSYRSKLKPDYRQVWAGICSAYVMLAAGVVVFATTESWLQQRIYFFLLILPIGACWIGYWLHYLLCFFHEATHYNILSDRRYNDWAANVVLGSLVGLSIKSYRKIHWLHHSNLGTTEDTETSYFEPLKLVTLVPDLLGRYQVEIILRYLRKASGGSAKPSGSKLALVITGLVHLSVGSALYLGGYPLTGVMWLLGFFSIYPLFTRLRQTLEHRSMQADDKIDYRSVDHGAVNRVFGSDLFSRTFGAAGFNGHLFHHLDPGISYTQFGDMEAFMMQTEYALIIEQNRTTYWKALRRELK